VAAPSLHCVIWAHHELAVQTASLAGVSTPSAPRWRVTTGRQDPDTVARLLALLPGWFGIKASNAAYVESARELPTYLAWPADIGDDCAAEMVAGRTAQRNAQSARTDAVGVLLAKRHFPEAAEIYLMAVDPALHRQGAGRALVEALTADLIADGCRLLQVKTQGPSHPDAGYALTRRFYRALRFLPVEETPDPWGPENPCLILIRVLA
jgi:GNAT superfamily N-acetyltransferase